MRKGGHVLEFWTVVASAAATVDARLAELRARLAARGAEELAAFHRELVATHRRAYRWELWAAFDLVRGGLSDQEFTAARNWLILQGRAAFDRAVADPDTLAELFPDDPDDLCAAGELSTLAVELLIERGAGGLAESLESPELFEDPAGDQVTGGLEQLRTHFPRIAKRYEGSAI
ncbi:DUF4240 domain-containing protein [Crossiella sp. SN42]|uniref:DUF4240 domain-containing protein n=1 Tax=Crossiella sp. SN42 TaxID=2944808 RepID=UPI00207C8E24|nr:DUF4240 domain-containing protein [Crossiella sp. SN42]MCO1581775.1 DUF4240 domain-containing protein [Crossiella sp. SN42]